MTITVSIIAVTVVVSWLAWQRPGLLDSLIYHGPSVRQGQWWRLLTHGFIHTDGAHLLFNMITLYFFGRLIEVVLTQRLDAAGYLLFYLIGIVVAILPTHFKHGRDSRYRSLGASGAVSAVLFSYILLQPWAMLFVMFVPLPAIVFAVLYVGYSVWAERHGRAGVNHSAHLWGAAWGVGFFLLLEPRWLSRFLEELLRGPF